MSGSIEIKPHCIRDFHILMQVSILLIIVDTLRAIIINKLSLKCVSFLIENFL